MRGGTPRKVGGRQGIPQDKGDPHPTPPPPPNLSPGLGQLRLALAGQRLITVVAAAGPGGVTLGGVLFFEGGVLGGGSFGGGHLSLSSALWDGGGFFGGWGFLEVFGGGLFLGGLLVITAVSTVEWGGNFFGGCFISGGWGFFGGGHLSSLSPALWDKERVSFFGECFTFFGECFILGGLFSRVGGFFSGGGSPVVGVAAAQQPSCLLVHEAAAAARLLPGVVVLDQAGDELVGELGGAGGSRSGGWGSARRGERCLRGCRGGWWEHGGVMDGVGGEATPQHGGTPQKMGGILCVCVSQGSIWGGVSGLSWGGYLSPMEGSLCTSGMSLSSGRGPSPGGGCPSPGRGVSWLSWESLSAPGAVPSPPGGPSAGAGGVCVSQGCPGSLPLPQRGLLLPGGGLSLPLGGSLCRGGALTICWMRAKLLPWQLKACSKSTLSSSDHSSGKGVKLPRSARDFSTSCLCHSSIPSAWGGGGGVRGSSEGG